MGGQLRVGIADIVPVPARYSSIEAASEAFANTNGLSNPQHAGLLC
jgi:hypothetical protein